MFQQSFQQHSGKLWGKLFHETNFMIMPDLFFPMFQQFQQSFQQSACSVNTPCSILKTFPCFSKQSEEGWQTVTNTCISATML